MEWKDWFDLMWDDIPCQRKMLVISSCLGEDLINPVRSDVNPHISIAAARDDELSWAGTEEENLPIIGCVMNHYLTSALLKNSADSNLNGDVSVEEAFQYSYGQIRDYYTNVVFPAFPDETSFFGGVAPHPVIDDAYTGEFSLRLEEAEPLENAGFPIWLIIAPIGAIGVVAVLVTLIVIRKRRK